MSIYWFSCSLRETKNYYRELATALGFSTNTFLKNLIASVPMASTPHFVRRLRRSLFSIPCRSPKEKSRTRCVQN